MIIRNGWHFPDMDQHFGRYKSIYPETKYQQHTLGVAYEHVKKFDNVIDIGANVGLHSVRFCQKFKNVYAFEPVHNNFECLEKNTEPFNNIKLYKIGLGDKNETLEISITKENNNCGAYSLVDFKDEANVINETIHIQRLDDYNLDADLIKVDVQGYEDKFLMGALETIRRCNPVVILEVEYKKAFNRLNSIMEPLNYYCVQSVKKDKIWIPR